jgi:hypothetical protein
MRKAPIDLSPGYLRADGLGVCHWRRIRKVLGDGMTDAVYRSAHRF